MHFIDCHKNSVSERVSDMYKQWHVWKKLWEVYGTLTKLVGELAQQQMAVLTFCLSDKTILIVSDPLYECEEDHKDPA